MEDISDEEWERVMTKMKEISLQEREKDTHPLFMTPEEVEANLGKNPDLEALTLLDYDGTPEEAAESERVISFNNE